MSQNDCSTSDTHLQSVLDTTIGKFLDLLANETEYRDIAERLREEVIGKGNTSEAVIKKALFGDDAS